MDSLWQYLAATHAALWVKESTWVYPLLETAHVIGLGLLFGAIAMMDIRLLGASRFLPVKALGRHLLPAAWVGFSINAVSGALLFVSDAAEFAANTAFRWKMVFILLAGLNALFFHRWIYAGAGNWNEGSRPPVTARAAAGLSLILWLAVITAGRMIAYVD